MDPVAVLVVIVVVAIVGKLWRSRQRERTGGDETGRSALDKVNYLIAYCREDLDPAKLAKGNDRYTHYYVAYLHEVARAISREEGITFSTAFQMPILLEAIRLCGADDTESRRRLMPRILSSEYGLRGTEDGKADGALAVAPSHDGPYWDRIRRYFES